MILASFKVFGLKFLVNRTRLFILKSGKSRTVRRRRSSGRSRESSEETIALNSRRESSRARLAGTIPRSLSSSSRKERRKRKTRRDISATREIPSGPHQYPKYFPSSGTRVYWLTDARDVRSRACLKAEPEARLSRSIFTPRTRVLRRDTRKIDASFFPQYTMASSYPMNARAFTRLLTYKAGSTSTNEHRTVNTNVWTFAFMFIKSSPFFSVAANIGIRPDSLYVIIWNTCTIRIKN